MLKANQKALQIFKDGEWKYVFCINYQDKTGPIITTPKRSKTLGAMYNLDYFMGKFGNEKFREA